MIPVIIVAIVLLVLFSAFVLIISCPWSYDSGAQKLVFAVCSIHLFLCLELTIIALLIQRFPSLLD